MGALKEEFEVMLRAPSLAFVNVSWKFLNLKRGGCRVEATKNIGQNTISRSAVVHRFFGVGGGSSDATDLHSG